MSKKAEDNKLLKNFGVNVNDYDKKQKPRKTGFDLISSGLKKQARKDLKKADMK